MRTRVVVVVVLLLLAALSPSAGAGPRTARTLDRARAAMSGRLGPRAATAALRDLALERSRLDGGDERRADALLARPTQPGSVDAVSYPSGVPVRNLCGGGVCVHWVTSGEHAPPAQDSDGDGAPDQAEFSLETFEHVASVVIGSLGYQPPKDDSASAEPGPNGATDIYLADTGAVGLYGYCASDDPALADPARAGRDASLYCVIDDDFMLDQFPGSESPTSALKATAAHEYFHAVQGGYDFGEDLWFMEATATWVEDVVFDDVSDHYRYLRWSAIPRPGFPIDYRDGGPNVSHPYGAWLFIRFLTEYFGSDGLPAHEVVRETWARAAWREGHPDDLDEFSAQALRNVVLGRGDDLPSVVANFHMNNFRAEAFYEEGQSYVDALVGAGLNPRPFLTKTHWFSRSTYTTGWWGQEVRHLSALNIGFHPREGVAASTRVRVQIDGPTAKSGPRARAIVAFTDGTYDMSYMRLNEEGDGAKTFAFGGGAVDMVTIAMVNGSTRYTDCGSGYLLSCWGRSRDDQRVFRWRATVVP
ncbi:MAG: MXAN_6640 family putative metalloprotease [Actinomycetota bacterium]